MINGIASFLGLNTAYSSPDKKIPHKTEDHARQKSTDAPTRMPHKSSSVKITLSDRAVAYMQQLDPDQSYVATIRPNSMKASEPLLFSPLGQTQQNDRQNFEGGVLKTTGNAKERETAGIEENLSAVNADWTETNEDDLVDNTVQTIQDALAYVRENGDLSPEDMGILEAAAQQFDQRLSAIVKPEARFYITDQQAEDVIAAEADFFDKFDQILGIELSADEQKQLLKAEADYKAVFDAVFASPNSEADATITTNASQNDGVDGRNPDDLARLQTAEQQLQAALDDVLGTALLPEQAIYFNRALTTFNATREQYFAGIDEAQLPENIRSRLDRAEDVYMMTLERIFATKTALTRQQEQQILQANALYRNAVQSLATDFSRVQKAS